MKFQVETPEGLRVTHLDHQSITLLATGSGSNSPQRIEHNVLLHSNGQYERWSAQRFETLTAEHFQALLHFGPRPEVVIFGSGLTLRFAPSSVLKALIHEGIGVETMNTGSACRTFNVLVNEGRSVIAALLL